MCDDRIHGLPRNESRGFVNHDDDLQRVDYNLNDSMDTSNQRRSRQQSARESAVIPVGWLGTPFLTQIFMQQKLQGLQEVSTVGTENTTEGFFKKDETRQRDLTTSGRLGTNPQGFNTNAASNPQPNMRARKRAYRVLLGGINEVVGCFFSVFNLACKVGGLNPVFCFFRRGCV